MVTNNDRCARVLCLSLAMGWYALIGATALLITTSAVARAQSARFDIAAQPLPSALRAFADQAHMQLLYEHSAVAGAIANPVVGELEKRAALEQLLSNSGLDIIYSSDNAATIRPAREIADKQATEERQGNVRNIRLAQADQTRLADIRKDNAAEKKSDRMEEIIVTAQRRDERLIDVPIAVTVLSAKNLEAAGVSYTRDLSQLTPGLIYSTTGMYATISLRGVSTEQTGPSAENNVALYIDGAYLPTKVSGIFDFPDVSGIEVLKGPQGTLYGRNATGGAILFKTADPSFDFGGNMMVGYGSFENRLVKGLVTGPLIGDLLAGSLSAYYEEKDGYNTNLVQNVRAGGIESSLVRGKLMLTPTQDIKLVLAGYYADRKDRDIHGLSQPNGSFGVIINPNAIVSTGPRTVATALDGYMHNRTVSASLRADIDTNYGAFNSTTAYTDIESEIWSDQTFTSEFGTRFHVNQPEKVFTEDLSFAFNRIGRFQFLAGASYYDDLSKFNPVTTFVKGLSPTVTVSNRYAGVRTWALAGFVEGDVAVTDRLNVIAGVRYTHENKTLSGSVNPAPDANTFPRIDEHSWDNVTPRFSVKYKLAEDTNVFATVSQGFKSGGYNASTLSPRTVEPEDVTAYETGIKSNISRKFAINASAFYYDYKDIQVQSRQGALSFLQNAGLSEIYGLDIDATYRPIDDLSFRLALAPLHAEYKEFPNAQVNVPRDSSTCPPAYRARGCGNTPVFLDLSGRRVQRTPKIAGSFSVDYAMHPKVGDVRLNANVYATDHFYWEESNRIKEPSYYVLNARVTWEPSGTPFTISAWGKNLTDEEYYLIVAPGPQGDNFLLAPPRTVGLSATMEF